MIWETLTQQIAKESGKTFGSKGQRAQLAKLQGAYEEAQRIVAAHTDQAAKAAWLDHQKELQAAIARGDLAKLDAYGRAEWESEFAEKEEAGKAMMRAITKECAPLVQELAEEFAAVAEDFAAKQAKAEADTYARFGVAYPGPSSLIAMLRRAADYARSRIPRGDHANASPASMVPYISF
jgi:hypothetical protein